MAIANFSMRLIILAAINNFLIQLSILMAIANFSMRLIIQMVIADLFLLNESGIVFYEDLPAIIRSRVVFLFFRTPINLESREKYTANKFTSFAFIGFLFRVNLNN